VANLSIDNDVEINEKDNYGLTALYRAAFNGHGTVISLLCNALDMSQQVAAAFSMTNFPSYGL